jgi:hypothetical protein
VGARFEVVFVRPAGYRWPDARDHDSPGRTEALKGAELKLQAFLANLPLFSDVSPAELDGGRQFSNESLTQDN